MGPESGVVDITPGQSKSTRTSCAILAVTQTEVKSLRRSGWSNVRSPSEIFGPVFRVGSGLEFQRLQERMEASMAAAAAMMAMLKPTRRFWGSRPRANGTTTI